jgi:hypothetical protein
MEYLRSYPLPYDLHLSLSFLFCLFCFVFLLLFTLDVPVSEKKKRKLPSDVTEGKTVFIRYARLIQSYVSPSQVPC